MKILTGKSMTICLVCLFFLFILLPLVRACDCDPPCTGCQVCEEGECVNDDTQCDSGDDEVCCDGVCCSSGEICCNDSCCDGTCCDGSCCDGSCCGGTCCDTTCCNDTCCQNGWDCINDECKKKCKSNSDCDTDNCEHCDDENCEYKCEDDRQCIDGECTCGDDDDCQNCESCTDSDTCEEDCQTGKSCCGGECCTDGKCCGGNCCETDCCDGVCCPADQVCENGKCTKSCKDDGDCSNEHCQKCNQGHCESKCGPEESCCGNGNCCEGSCCGDTCCIGGESCVNGKCGCDEHGCNASHCKECIGNECESSCASGESCCDGDCCTSSCCNEECCGSTGGADCCDGECCDNECCSDKEDSYCCGGDLTCCKGACCDPNTETCCDGTCCNSSTQKCCDDIGGSEDGYCCEKDFICCQGNCCDPCLCQECDVNTCVDKCDQFPCKQCDGEGDCDCYEIASVSSIDYVCVGCDVTFTATTSPAGKCSCVEWSGGGDPASQSGGCTFTTNWDTTGTKTVTASIDGCPGSEQKQVTIVEVDTLIWETYYDNITIDTCPNNGGKRIYPGKQDPTDGSAADRKKVYVVATITPARSGVTIYFQWYDVDDPCSDISPIDTNGSTGDDNKGSGESLSPTSASTDANGEASVLFTVSMQPGDNFRVFASCNNSELNEMTQEKADTMENLPDTVVGTEMLTTWRTLWIERDSMAAVATTGNEKNLTTSTIVTLDAASYNSGTNKTILEVADLESYWDDNDILNGGKLAVGGNEYLIIDMYDTNFAETLLVQGNPYGDGVRVNDGCTLYDDDYAGSGNFKVILPQYNITLDALRLNAYREGYIEPVYLSATYSDQVDFNLNLSDWEVEYGLGDWDDKQDFVSANDFWHCLVVSCYQDDSSSDLDGEFSGTEGVVDEDTSQNTNVALLFLETNRDMNDTAMTSPISCIMGHEMGHTGGGRHGDGELMGDINGSFSRDANSFSDTTLQRFRSKVRWLETN